MRKCCVLLVLVILNHLAWFVQSDWSIRKIFMDNLDGKKASKGISGCSCRSHSTLSPLASEMVALQLKEPEENGDEPEEGGDEEDKESGDDDLYGYEYTNRNRNRHRSKNYKRKKYTKEKSVDNVLIKNHCGHLSGEIRSLGNNSESFEIILKPTKINMKNSNKNKKHHRHRNFHCRRRHNKHTSSKCNNDNNNDYDINRNRCGNKANENHSDEDKRHEEDIYEDYKEEGNTYGENYYDYIERNDDDFIKKKHYTNVNDKPKLIETYKFDGRGDSELTKISTNKRDFNENQPSTIASVKVANEIQKVMQSTVPVNNSPTPFLDPVKVNGSVEGIIVMNFNFSDARNHNSEIRGNIKESNIHKPPGLKKNNDYSVNISADTGGSINTIKKEKYRTCKLCNSCVKLTDAKSPSENTNCELYEAEEKVKRKPKNANHNHNLNKSDNKNCFRKLHLKNFNANDLEV